MQDNEQDLSSTKTDLFNMGWGLWLQIAFIIVIVKFFGLVGGLMAWAIWSFIVLIIKKNNSK